MEMATTCEHETFYFLNMCDSRILLVLVHSFVRHRLESGVL